MTDARGDGSPAEVVVRAPREAELRLDFGRLLGDIDELAGRRVAVVFHPDAVGSEIHGLRGKETRLLSVISEEGLIRCSLDPAELYAPAGTDPGFRYSVLGRSPKDSTVWASGVADLHLPEALPYELQIINGSGRADGGWRGPDFVSCIDYLARVGRVRALRLLKDYAAIGGTNYAPFGGIAAYPGHSDFKSVYLIAATLFPTAEEEGWREWLVPRFSRDWEWGDYPVAFFGGMPILLADSWRMDTGLRGSWDERRGVHSAAEIERHLARCEESGAWSPPVIAPSVDGLRELDRFIDRCVLDEQHPFAESLARNKVDGAFHAGYLRWQMLEYYALCDQADVRDAARRLLAIGVVDADYWPRMLEIIEEGAPTWSMWLERLAAR